MISVNDYKLSQTTELLNSTFNSNNKTNEAKSEADKITNISKKDLLSISSQIEISNKKSEKTTTDYAALEKKLGIDSSKWGVEAVSDDIFNFVKTVYEDYKTRHNGEDSQEMLDKFYEMAKSSVSQGYGEAMDFLGAVSEDIGALTKGTYDKTIEKIDAWYKNGGVDVVSAEETPSTEKIAETFENVEVKQQNKLTAEQLLQESENMKNQVLEMLKQQGIYLTEKETKKPFFNFEG